MKFLLQSTGTFTGEAAQLYTDGGSVSQKPDRIVLFRGGGCCRRFPPSLLRGEGGRSTRAECAKRTQPES